MKRTRLRTPVSRLKWMLVLLLWAGGALAGPPSSRPQRARDLGLCPGSLPSGPLDCITDVNGVRVGHCTVFNGEGPLRPGQGPVRTGVTAILPCPDPWGLRHPAAAFVLNGNGEMTGLAYLQDLGWLETPILLTNTLNVGKVADAAVSWIVAHHPGVGITEDVPIPVVAECDDSFLNDIQGRHVGTEQVLQALEQASTGPVEEGAVGAGTGMVSYDFKAGIGTASRRLPGGPTVGVLVNANHGVRSELTILGVPVGRDIPAQAAVRRTAGSIIMVVATDAPLSTSQLTRLARRATLGLARTGTCGYHGSGDLVVSFTTANALPRGAKASTVAAWPDEQLDPLYQAAVEASEEAVINALLRARTVTGRDGNTAVELPLERLAQVMRGYGRPMKWP